MSEMIPWIQAEAERGLEGEFEFLRQRREKRRHEVLRNDASDALRANLPAHQFPATEHVEDTGSHVSQNHRDVGHPIVSVAQAGGTGEAEALDELEERAEGREQERRAYRGRTVAMLRKYLRYSLETGRVPSLVGREFFRSKVTKYRVTTFEDRVIFVHDMENCIQRLDEFTQRVLARVVLQEYEHEEAAQLLGCTRRTVYRKLFEGLDALSDILIEVGLLTEFVSAREKSCQEGETSRFLVSDSGESE